MPYTFDDRHDPLISMQIHGWLSDVELGQLIGDLDRLTVRARPFAVVLDTSGLRVPELVHLRRLVAWFDDNRHASARWQRGLACIVTTPMIRGMLANLLNPLTSMIPVTMVEAHDDARRWAHTRLMDPPGPERARD